MALLIIYIPAKTNNMIGSIESQKVIVFPMIFRYPKIAFRLWIWGFSFIRGLMTMNQEIYDFFFFFCIIYFVNKRAVIAAMFRGKHV